MHRDLVRTKTSPYWLAVPAYAIALALSAQWAFPLPFSPVPITLQTLFVLLAGVIFGARLGALAVLLYLIQGVAGLPVFANGASGAAYLLGPTGGYLLGFVAAAFVVGWLFEHGGTNRVWKTLLTLLAGHAVIYACGTLWLGTLIGFDKVLSAGVLPFLPGDLTKTALAMLLLPVVKRTQSNE